MIESVSRRALSGSSGSYHVRGAELAKNRRLKSLSATVAFLDDTQHTFQLDKRAKGQALLDLVFQHLELVEKDYFGLQYAENGATACTYSPDVMRWLDPTKPVKKQLRSKGGQFYFRVKFYVSDPSKLQEEYTRYQFYLQIRRDILQGKLQLPPSTACLIASYTVQSELGDYQPEEHGAGYLSRLQLIPGQTEEMEKKIAELHKLHKGQLPADAEFNFLDHAKRLDMYGVELHKARVCIYIVWLFINTRALSGSSGSYHVRGAELARNRRLKSLSATVAFLDDTQHTFQLDKRAKGQALLDLVFQHLELVEKDYFGLQYAENGATACTYSPDVMVTHFPEVKRIYRLLLHWREVPEPIYRPATHSALLFALRESSISK